ncbi:MAG TPA: GIY-YIG nuclease family protein, partial [Candidatus Limnocylindrales bacterium]
MTPQLQATLAKLPTKPGVYLLKDKNGRVLYVGKAQSLRNRVRQYWQAGRGAQAPLRIESAIDRVA